MLVANLRFALVYHVALSPIRLISLAEVVGAVVGKTLSAAGARVSDVVKLKHTSIFDAAHIIALTVVI